MRHSLPFSLTLLASLFTSLASAEVLVDFDAAGSNGKSVLDGGFEKTTGKSDPWLVIQAETYTNLPFRKDFAGKNGQPRQAILSAERTFLLDTKHAIKVGEMFHLSFDWAPFHGWRPNTELVAMLYCTDDNSITGRSNNYIYRNSSITPIATFKMRTNASKRKWERKEFTSEAMSKQDLAGKRLFLGFYTTNIAFQFARIDNVTLKLHSGPDKKPQKIRIVIPN